jgi:salicylate hydroxylase
MYGAVIGAGIAGVSMTHALRRLGVQMDLFEQSPEARSTGYQLNVLPNGKYALGQIGLLDALAASGCGAPIRSFVFQDGLSDGIIRRIVFPASDRYGGTSFYRADLHKTLLQALDGNGPNCGRTADTVTNDAAGDTVTVRFSDGETRVCDFVIGADGIHSKIRRALFPEHRGFVPCFDALLFGAQVNVNGGSPAETRFAEQERQGEFVQISAPRTSVVLSAAGNGRFGVIMLAAADRTLGVASPESARALARELAREIRDPRVRHAIDVAAWDPGNPLVWHIGDIEPLTMFHAGRIALTGDAAHAMIPVVGQGANQAFEDAMVLSRLIRRAKAADIPRVFERYSADRSTHVALLQRAGRRGVRMALVPNRFAHFLRGMAMVLFVRRGFEDLGRHMLRYATADPDFRDGTATR